MNNRAKQSNGLRHTFLGRWSYGLGWTRTSVTRWSESAIDGVSDCRFPNAHGFSTWESPRGYPDNDYVILDSLFTTRQVSSLHIGLPTMHLFKRARSTTGRGASANDPSQTPRPSRTPQSPTDPVGSKPSPAIPVQDSLNFSYSAHAHFEPPSTSATGRKISYRSEEDYAPSHHRSVYCSPRPPDIYL